MAARSAIVGGAVDVPAIGRVMDILSDVLVEVHRLQVLSFIQRNSRRPVSLSTSWDLASWLRVDVQECDEVVGELIEEGFVEPLPESSDRRCVPLELTRLGRGFLAWVNTREPPD